MQLLTPVGMSCLRISHIGRRPEPNVPLQTETMHVEIQHYSRNCNFKQSINGEGNIQACVKYKKIYI